MPEANPSSVRAKLRAVAYNWYTNTFGREVKAEPPIHGVWPDFIPNTRNNKLAQSYTENIPLPAPPVIIAPPILGSYPGYVKWPRLGIHSYYTELVGREPDAGPVPQVEFQDFLPKDWTRRTAANKTSQQLFGREAKADPVPQGEYPDYIVRDWGKRTSGVRAYTYSPAFQAPIVPPPIPANFPAFVPKDWSKRQPATRSFITGPRGLEAPPAPPVGFPGDGGMVIILPLEGGGVTVQVIETGLGGNTVIPSGDGTGYSYLDTSGSSSNIPDGDANRNDT